MLSGLLGKKVGMSHLFGEDGRLVPVTVMEVGPCVVIQVRTRLTDGYEAVQLGFGETKQLNKPAQGHLRRARAVGVRNLREFAVTDVSAHEVGQVLNVSQFFVGERVHVTAHSKGRGFQGVMKRHGFHGGPKTHGQKDPGQVSRLHRCRHVAWPCPEGPEDAWSHGQSPGHRPRPAGGEG